MCGRRGGVGDVGAIIGYARTCCSTTTWTPAQVEALTTAGARRVFVDAGVAAGRQVRLEWEHCLDYLRDGEDTLVAGADRIARGALQLAETLTLLHSRAIGFQSLDGPTRDITTADGASTLIDLLGVLVGLDRAGRASPASACPTRGRLAGSAAAPRSSPPSCSSGRGSSAPAVQPTARSPKTSASASHHPTRPHRRDAGIAPRAVLAVIAAVGAPAGTLRVDDGASG